MKGFIVYISSEVKDSKQYVYLFGRLENGETFLAIDHFRPYFYIKTADRKKAEKLEKVEFENTQCKSFENDLMTKVTLNLSKDVPLVRDLFIDAGIACYEADIRYVNRYLIDKDLKGAIDLEGEYERPSEGTIDRMYLEPTIKPTQDYFPKLKVLSIDIETDKHAGDLYAIGLYTPTFQKVLIKKKGKFTNAEAIPDEERLLERFQELVLEIDPDILTGWNFIDFDLKYLQDRFKKHKLEFRLGRINRPTKLRITDSFFKDSSADVPGRMVLDGIHLLKISHVKLDDYKLETASKMFVGEGKIFSGPNRHDQIDVAFEKDPQLLIDYNLKDAKLAYDVIEKSDALNLTIRRSLLTRLPLDRVQGSIAALDSVYLKALQEIQVVAPSSANLERDERIKGGHVLEPQPGIYDNILVFDFKSLYPSIMRTFNIDPYRFVPAAKAKGKKNLIEAPNGACFKRDEGVLPNLIQRLWQERDAAKKRKDKLSTYAIKIMMNCFSPDTEILTSEGIKKITDVKKNDFVYSLNPKTKQVELNKITKTFRYLYKGKMISMQSNCVDFIVTPNHRFFMKTEQGYQWFEAQELYKKATKNFWLPKHIPIRGRIIEEMQIEKKCNELGINFRWKGDKLQKARKHSSISKTYKMKDWLELMGWYISEGYIYINKPKKYPGKVSWRGIAHKIIIAQEQKKNREEIIKLLDKMGLKYSLDKKAIIVTNQILAEILLEECGHDSYSKKIPRWVFTLDSKILYSLFKTLMLGDGDEDEQRYSTCSKFLAQDVLRLVHHIGRYGYLYEDKGVYKGDAYVMHRVQINRTRGIEPYISKYRNIREINYEGYVYCVEVSPNHTVLAGRNTKLNFCGQSIFGVMANPTCRFYSLDMANAITSFGRFFIQQAASQVEKWGYHVIYGDTDSCFINPQNKNYKEVNALGAEIAQKLNDYFTEYIKKTYKLKSFLEIQFERVFKKFFLPQVRKKEEGAKKRYAGLVEQEGKEEIVYVGLETVRRDWTNVAKKFQQILLDRVFHEQEIVTFIRSFVRDLKEGKYDDLLVYRKGIRKAVDSYTKTTPPHIKAARKIGRSGTGIIEYIQTVNGPEALEAHTSLIDYEHYIKKQLRPIAESILVLLGKSFEDITNDHKQFSLDAFK